MNFETTSILLEAMQTYTENSKVEITTENKDFQPMNANFGVLPPLDKIVRDKAERKRQMAERSLLEISSFKKEIELYPESRVFIERIIKHYEP